MVRSYLLPFLREALRATGAPEGVPIVLEYPRGDSRWDLATPVALALAPLMADASEDDMPARNAPMEIAHRIVEALAAEQIGIEEIAIAPPGFINFRFSMAFWHARLRAMLAARKSSSPREPAGHAEITITGLSFPETSRELHAADQPLDVANRSLAEARVILVAQAIGALLGRSGWRTTVNAVAGDAGNGPPAIRIHREGANGVEDRIIQPNMHVTAEANDAAGTAETRTFGELAEEIGEETARWILLDCDPARPLAIGLAEARVQSERVRSRYVAYARARAAGVLRHAASEGIAVGDDAPLELLLGEAEIGLIRQMAGWDDILERAAATLAPAAILEYMLRLAAALNRFMQECRIIAEPSPLREARLALLAAARHGKQSNYEL